MLPEKNYLKFARKVSKILRDCYYHTEYPGQEYITIERERLPDGSYPLIQPMWSFSSLTKDNIYYFNETKALEHREELLEICASLPKQKIVLLGTAGTIAYTDLLPEGITTHEELIDDCEFADKFIALLRFNSIAARGEFVGSDHFSAAPIYLFINIKTE